LDHVSVDLQVLVVYLEILTAVILRCLRPGNPDGVVLPRSFLLQFVQRRRPPKFDLSELEPLFSPLQQLVESIHLNHGIVSFYHDRAFVLPMNDPLSRLASNRGTLAGQGPDCIPFSSDLSKVGERLNLQSLTLPLYSFRCLVLSTRVPHIVMQVLTLR
jgi:hypothetical protein